MPYVEQIVYQEAIEISPKGSGNPDWDKRRNFLPGRCRALTTILLCAATFTRPMVAATVLGTVAGTVVDGTGKPVSNAHVTISFALPANVPHLPGPPVITSAHAASATADAFGTFKIGNLRAGQYVACAQTIAPGLLDPCHWAAAAPAVPWVAPAGIVRCGETHFPALRLEAGLDRKTGGLGGNVD